MGKGSATLEAVRWLEWGDEAFARAKAEGKLVLLGISATWCHWCHVMDRTTYGDPDVIGEIGARFVPVRVDTDRRPDINRRYNLGGWPTTAILTPDGELVTGGTYMPPERLFSLLNRVDQLWTTQPEDFANLGDRLPPELAGEAEPGEPGGEGPANGDDGDLDALGRSFTAEVIAEAEAAFDHRFGGFGSEPKFPHTLLLRFLSEEADRAGAYPNAARIVGSSFHQGPGDEHQPEEVFAGGSDETEANLHRGQPPLGGDVGAPGRQLAGVVATSLAGMSGGGLFDHEAGGFFRYSTTRDWRIPHFEKMLEDNAGLLELYLDGYSLTGDIEYRRVADWILDYVLGTLADSASGGFFGSQDADEDYYGHDLSERERLSPPSVDRTIYTNWNALMAAAFLKAGAVLPDPEASSYAVRTLERLLNNMRAPDGSLYHYHDGKSTGLPGQLADQAETARALLCAWQHTGVSGYLGAARELADWAISHCLDAEDGAFFDARVDPGARGALQRRTKPVEENAAMVEVLLTLHAATGNEKYHVIARGTLAALLPGTRAQGIMAAPLASAWRRYASPGPAVRVVGSRDDLRTVGLWRAALASYAPGKIVELVEATDDHRLAQLGLARSDLGLAYVCVGETCLPPVVSPAELAGLLAHTPGR